MKNKFWGFTILELCIVVVIIGILATLGLASFSGSREQSMEKEALSNLKLIASAEKFYRLEHMKPFMVTYIAYIACADTAAVNTNLGLQIPSNDLNWRYKVIVSVSYPITFSAKAQRTSGFASGKTFCINDTQDVPQTAGCTW